LGKLNLPLSTFGVKIEGMPAMTA